MYFFFITATPWKCVSSLSKILPISFNILLIVYRISKTIKSLNHVNCIFWSTKMKSVTQQVTDLSIFIFKLYISYIPSLIPGYHFLCKLPPPLEYNFSAGNTFTELRQLKNVKELMTNDYPWFERDMKKFPRFPSKRERTPPINDTFPFVLLAK